jgi:hypothetical protein
VPGLGLLDHREAEILKARLPPDERDRHTSGSPQHAGRAGRKGTALELHECLVLAHSL